MKQKSMQKNLGIGLRRRVNKMSQKIEIDANELYGLVYTLVRHVGVKQLPKDMDKEAFQRGASIFMYKLRELIPEEKKEVSG